MYKHFSWFSVTERSIYTNDMLLNLNKQHIFKVTWSINYTVIWTVHATSEVLFKPLHFKGELMIYVRKWQRDIISSVDASALLLILWNAVSRWSWRCCLGSGERELDTSALSSIVPRSGEGCSSNSLATHLPSWRRINKGGSLICSGIHDLWRKAGKEQN